MSNTRRAKRRTPLNRPDSIFPLEGVSVGWRTRTPRDLKRPKVTAHCDTCNCAVLTYMDAAQRIHMAADHQHHFITFTTRSFQP